MKGTAMKNPIHQKQTMKTSILFALITICLNHSLFAERRCDDTGEFQPAQNLGFVVNSPVFDGGPTVDKKETELIFVSRRDGSNDDL
jgi:hypothetical protein